MNFLLMHEVNEGPVTRVAIENINSYRAYDLHDESEGTIVCMKGGTIYVEESASELDRFIVRAGGKLILGRTEPARHHPPRTNQEP